MSNQRSRYLRNAPRPAEWEEMEEAILGRLGSNAQKTLESTLEQLRTKYNWEPKKGPGRKSNAEHAIHFYEYLLEKVKETGDLHDNNQQEDEKSSGSAAEEEEEEEDYDEEEKNKESLSSPLSESAEEGTNKDDDDDDDDDNYDDDEEQEDGGGQEYKDDNSGNDVEEEAASERIQEADEKKGNVANKEHSNSDSPEPRHDKCDVCFDSQKQEHLLKCTSCPNVFHLSCVRPVMDQVPDDEATWRCSYCVLATEPKNSKSRREAAAAVRLMARLRNGIKRRKAAQNQDRQSESETEETEREDKSAKMETKRESVDNQEGGQHGEDNDNEDESDQENNESEVMDVDDDEEDTQRDLDENSQVESGQEESMQGGQDAENDAASDVTGEEEQSEEDDDDDNDDNEANVREEDGGDEELSAEKGEEDAVEDERGDGENEDDALTTSSDSARQRKNVELSKLANTWTGKLESPDDGRGSRRRKQPNHYDPQLVPARKWQSDEVTQSDADSGAEDNTKDGPDKETKKTNQDSAAANENRPFKQTGEPVCVFCADDPEIPLCCFCACRQCLGKRDKDKIVTCSDCQDLYHFYCLDPPLTEKPQDSSWSCPSCKKAKRKPSPRSPAKGKPARSSAGKVIAKRPVGRPPSQKKVQLKKRPVGRPPKNKNISKSRSPSRKSSRAPTTTKADAPVKRKRGRPPKNAQTTTAAAAKKPKGRKRGRPPKVKEEAPPQKRLKPPMRSSNGRFMSPPPGAPQGRKGKGQRATKVVKMEHLPDAPVEMMDPTPIITSRSGRTVKRSSFHDEIDEGEQHLKTQRQQLAAQADMLRKSTGEDAMDVDEENNAVSGDHVIASQPFASTENAAAVASSAAPDPARRRSLPPGVQVVQQGTQYVRSTASLPGETEFASKGSRGPRRKPGARECMQISRRFGVRVIPDKYIEILTDYCSRGKVEHLVRMRSRLDEHSQFLETQLAGLEAVIQSKGNSDVVVPPLPEQQDRRLHDA